MQSTAATIQEYLTQLPEDRKAVFGKLRNVILENLPEGFEECMNYGMLGYVVPHAIYPDGYHCNKSLPLPFINLASQKNSINFYHMGIYSDPDLLQWFTQEHRKYINTKLDMGKSCIRFKDESRIPYKLIAQLVKKISVDEWITRYESVIKK